MPRTITAVDGNEWEVALTGRQTQYERDEISLVFSRRDSAGLSIKRYARFSPRGAKSAERAYQQVTNAFLVRLLSSAQPEWTAPDGGYGREE